MNGFEATAQIRSIENNIALEQPPLAILAFTGKEIDDQDELFKHGMNGYIAKYVE